MIPKSDQDNDHFDIHTNQEKELKDRTIMLKESANSHPFGSQKKQSRQNRQTRYLRDSMERKIIAISIMRVHCTRSVKEISFQEHGRILDGRDQQKNSGRRQFQGPSYMIMD
jgi:hypothetical protein